MNEKTDRIPRRLATIGLPLALMLALLLALSVVADDTMPGTGGVLVQYEIRLADVNAGQLEVELPAGFEYVGLAAGSQVVTEPEISPDGGRLVWDGPLAGDVLRFWLAPGGLAAVPETLEVAGSGVQAVRVEPAATFPERRVTEGSAAVLAGTISVTKSVEPDRLEPGDNRWVTYEAVFTHSSPEMVVLDRITDTLPTDFLFGGMAFGSDVITAPVQVGDSQYVWENVSFTDTLTLRYNVRAVDLSGVYLNSIEARAGSEPIDPASAPLTVEGAEVSVFIPVVVQGYQLPAPAWELIKQASPAEVESGDMVEYMVKVKNAGTLTGTLGTLADTLPDDFEFVTMLPGSDITTAPLGTTGRVAWEGLWPFAPGDELTLRYQTESGGGGEKVNTFGIHTPGGYLLATTTSTVTVGGGLPFEDDFTDGVSSDWQPFLNWPGLSEDRWFWHSWGYYGYDTFEVLPANTNYDLSIYNGEGAQEWTDYRIEAKLKDSKEDEGLKRGLTGIWFRGTYEDSGAMDGKTVGGYYVYMKPPDENLYLMRVKPGEDAFNTQEVLAKYYYAPRIGRRHWYDLIIEVEGTHIEVWFGDETDGMFKAFNYVDAQNTWPHGTVGFATYYTTAYLDYIRVLPLD